MTTDNELMERSIFLFLAIVTINTICAFKNLMQIHTAVMNIFANCYCAYVFFPKYISYYFIFLILVNIGNVIYFFKHQIDEEIRENQEAKRFSKLNFEKCVNKLGNICPICFDEIDKNHCKITKCLHIYHDHCWDMYQKSKYGKPLCPYCQSQT